MGSDKFLVYGEHYKIIRDQIAQESLQRNLPNNLDDVSVMDYNFFIIFKMTEYF